MAKYHYDEAGNMAAYFLISVLAILLVPLTLSSLFYFSTSNPDQRTTACQCKPCQHRRTRVLSAQRPSIFNPRFSKRTVFLILGWSLFAFLALRVPNADPENKVYDPYDILGISPGVSEKDIKSLFKKLSKVYHPDKVKATVNQTVEEIANHFVEITKAYKALTDETIRRNYELYGHPDGRQEVSMGIALPSWIIEGKNNIWVLGFYAILIGGLLPTMVGRWWFGSRGKTKDGIEAKSAEGFWKGIDEASEIGDIVKAVGNVFRFESRSKSAGDLTKVEEEIENRVGNEWKGMVKAISGGEDDAKSRRALALLYAHFLRLDLGSKALEKEQSTLLLQTPMLLNAFLNITAARSWLSPTLSVMRLHAYIVQALVPGQVASPQAQLPGFDGASSSEKQGVATFVKDLKKSGDERALEAGKALESWPSLEVVDIAFKVIGERVVTPSSIVYLLVKLRIKVPGTSSSNPVRDAKTVKKNDEIDEKFLHTRGEAEQLEGNGAEYAHAPYWPGLRKPGWWLVLADDKSNRTVVPPLKITDVPRSDSSRTRNYRCYKVQFQAPPNVGLFTWKVYLVSDTIVGEETCQPISLKIEDASVLAADEQTLEDDISDPEEDSLAGQMAAMRGQAVKKAAAAESDDDESGTDDEDGGGGDDSSSDSD